MSEQRAAKNNHLNIVVAEGKVTLEDLHAALDQAIRHVGGGCNCGLTGFDLTGCGKTRLCRAVDRVPTFTPTTFFCQS
jgi:hypothetical protein